MKKRVNDLAKEYGIDGASFASKLRELGFDKAKSHMTMLDDFDLMMIQARLEASGLVSEKIVPPVAEAESTKKAAPKKKSTKKTGEEEATAAVVEETPQEEEIEVTAAKAKKTPASKGKKKSTKKTEETEPIVTTESETEPITSKNSTETIPEPEVTESIVETPTVETPIPTPAPTPAPIPAPPKRTLPPPKPAPPRKTATILGRIDPSKLGTKTVPPKEKERAAPAPTASGASQLPKTKKQLEEEEAVRLKASKLVKRPRTEAGDEDINEALAEVHPTFLHDPSKTFARGDTGDRTRLTAAQLIEKELARYQRKREIARRGKNSGRNEEAKSNTPVAPITIERKGKIALTPPITVRSFSIALGIKPAELIRKLMSNQFMATMNSALDDETIQLMALEFGQEVEIRRGVDLEKHLIETVATDSAAGQETKQSGKSRPPVIAFLGHVDHGKTSLLDSIRQSNVTKGEAGGITQHIGAYQVKTEKGHTVTILDTPGHEAFTAMRARGAQTTDIVVLVVAADDGVMPQTLEAISHIKAAKVPVIIALNKIDKKDANPKKVRQQLASADLAPEDWGGNIGIVETSATKGTGVQELLERVSLESEILELKADAQRSAMGTVLEASISEGKGIVAHLLVQDGTLRKGDILLAGTGYGRVRNIYNDRGEELEEAGPSTPVEVTGLSALPGASDKFYVIESFAQARETAENRASQKREQGRSERPAVSLENLFDRIKAGEIKELPVILKTDVQGSLEALKKEFEKLKDEEVKLRVLHSAVGGINESDIDLAATMDAIVLGFHVVADDKARIKADRQNVQIRSYQIIYEMLDDLRKAMEGMLKPTMREAVTGHATIRQVFRISKFGNIAGCYVTDGSILRSNPIRLIRNNIVIYSGKLGSLKRIKDDAREVKTGYECGIKIDGYDDIKEGDVIESYEVKEEKRTL